MRKTLMVLFIMLIVSISIVGFSQTNQTNEVIDKDQAVSVQL